jgi:hypothetical protein
MPTDEQQMMNNRVQELVKKTSEWTDNELSEPRRLMDGLAVGGGVIQTLCAVSNECGTDSGNQEVRQCERRTGRNDQ